MNKKTPLPASLPIGTAGRRVLLCGVATAMGLGSPALAQTSQDAATALDEVVVTATARPEARSRLTGTVQVVDEQVIQQSATASLTDLLAQNSVGFFSQWTPGQTSINIRGGASDGQGRDFKGQVLVLVNGRRAGTANLSKFSSFDTSRIEVVRGPSSVVYGSQNIGGVVNVITKTGLTDPGTEVQVTGGSWGLASGSVATGGAAGSFDWFLGASAGRQGDYHVGGGGEEENTAWKRHGLSAEVGYQFNDDHRLSLALRSDGIYDAGFRGSSANIYSTEDRYNNSADLTYAGSFLDGRVRLNEHVYFFRDIDDLKWASPIVRSSAGLPVAGTSSDHNKRRVQATGSQFRPQITLWTDNNLTLGWDWEHSTVRSTRERLGVDGAAISQVAPYDNNQTEDVHAFYFEDAQAFFDDRLILRGGVRYTTGDTTFDPTPNLANVLQTTRSYDTTTYSAGLTFRAAPGLNVRLGAASGFRAPNATELAADFVALGGSQTYGNADLRPETSEQVELGANYSRRNWWIDAALFRNVISDRITTQLRTGSTTISDYVNNPGDVDIVGAELQGNLDILALLGRDGGAWFWSLSGSGNYNFRMRDEGAASTANTDKPVRVYKSQASFSTRFGQNRTHSWSGQLQAVYSGPVYYDTEENLLIPLGEPTRNYIHKIDSYWLVNARGEVAVTPTLKAFAAVNNLLDKNYSPLFIGLDKEPYLLDPQFTNGGSGTSSPGRSFQVGLKLSF